MEAARIAQAFGLSGAAALSDGPVARGKQGLVWRLDTPDGSWAVKVPLDAPAEDEVRAAAAFQESAHAAGVPSPTVRRTPAGDVLARVGRQVVRLYGWVDLLPGDRQLDPAAVGAVVARMHLAGRPQTGPADPWYVDPVGPDRWAELLDELRRAGAPFAGALADLRDEFVALESWLEPADELRTCHCDLWADNVLPAEGGGLCVIDWDNSGPADPSQELAYVLFEYGRTDPARARALVEAYADAGGPGRVTRRGHFSMLIAMLGHVTELAARDWLQPNPRSPERADAVAWISEGLRDPHTRDRLDALLDAVC